MRRKEKKSNKGQKDVGGETVIGEYSKRDEKTFDFNYRLFTQLFRVAEAVY